MARRDFVFILVSILFFKELDVVTVCYQWALVLMRFPALKFRARFSTGKEGFQIMATVSFHLE